MVERTDKEFQGLLTIHPQGSGKGYGIVATKSGEIFATGTIDEAMGGRNVWLARLDGEANQIDAATVDAAAHGDDRSRALAVDKSGNLFVAGAVTGGTTGTNIGIGRFDPNLDLVKEATFVGPGDDEAFGIATSWR